jgi:hypothetical protein
MLWLSWTLIPALALAAQDWAIEQATAGLPNPASIDAALGTFFLTAAMLVPLVAVSQCFMVHRIWPDAWWLFPAWFFINIASVVATLMLAEHKTFTIVLVGLGPAIALSLASPKPLRLSVFGQIFVYFGAGAALVRGIPDMQFFPAFWKHSSEIALLIGTAVSGLGLWVVSRWTTPGLRNADQGS